MDLINRVFLILGISSLIFALFLGIQETNNELEYYKRLLEKVGDGTIEDYEYDALMRWLNG